MTNHLNTLPTEIRERVVTGINVTRGDVAVDLLAVAALVSEGVFSDDDSATFEIMTTFLGASKEELAAKLAILRHTSAKAVASTF